MRRSFLVTGLLLVSALVWAARLAAGAGPWPPDAAAVLAADLVLLAAVSTVGILVAAARWASRLAAGIAAAGLPLALVLPADALWWIGLLGSATALGGILGGGLKGFVRERPNASGPPAEAVLLALGLAALPGATAAAAIGGLGPLGWIVALASLATVGWYVKAAPAATTTVRIAVPVLTVLAALVPGWPGGVVPAALGVALTRLAWTRAARVAVRPLVESGKPVSIPAELTPREILDAAGLDEHGRPRRDRP